jgi:DNA-binding beta-propeller fold protein YncE
MNDTLNHRALTGSRQGFMLKQILHYWRQTPLTVIPNSLTVRNLLFPASRPMSRILVLILAVVTSMSPVSKAVDLNPLPTSEHRYLYVAEPGIRNYIEHGGVGIIVFDVDNNFKVVKRIPTWDMPKGKEPEAIKGICASAKTGRLYVSTTARLLCIDLVSDKHLWEKAFEGGCDRMSITPDGKTIYLPSLEGPIWNVVNAETGDLVTKIEPNSGAHNTICGLNGKDAYLAGLKSPLLYVADTKTQMTKTIGPFSNVIRPFTVNGKQTLCFVNVNDLLGFEIGDLITGKMLCRVEVPGDKPGPTKRHGCPSHGIAFTPDEKELWLTDAANSKLHIFDAAVMPPKQIATIPLRDQPGWITFSLDGKFAFPSTGEVIDPTSRRVLTTLTDETGRAVQSEKMLEIIFKDGKPIRNGDQFGLGRRR